MADDNKQNVGWNTEAQEAATEMCGEHKIESELQYMKTFLECVQSSSDRGDTIAGEREHQNRDKIESYAYWLPTLVQFLPVWERKGKGSKLAAGKLRKDLDAMLKLAGMSKGVAKRYIENGRGMLLKSNKIRKEVIDAAENGPNAMQAWFDVNEIKTESRIKELWAAPVDPSEALAKRVAKMNQHNRKHFDDLVKKYELLYAETTSSDDDDDEEDEEETTAEAA